MTECKNSRCSKLAYRDDLCADHYGLELFEEITDITCTHGVSVEKHCDECGKVFKHNADGGVLKKKLRER